MKKAERERRVREVAELLELTEYLRAQAGPAVRRAAPAGGDGAGDRSRAERVPDGRAALEPRRKAARADARRHRRAAVAARRDHGLRHPRPGRGDDARASRCSAQGRAPPAVRRAAGAVRAAGEHVRRRVHRLAVDEPARGAERTDGCSFCGVEIPLPAGLQTTNGEHRARPAAGGARALARRDRRQRRGGRGDRRRRVRLLRGRYRGETVKLVARTESRRAPEREAKVSLARASTRRTSSTRETG